MRIKKNMVSSPAVAAIMVESSDSVATTECGKRCNKATPSINPPIRLIASWSLVCVSLTKLGNPPPAIEARKINRQ